MKFSELWHSIHADQYRYGGRTGFTDFWRQWSAESGFRFTVVMRWCAYFRSQWWSRWGVYHLVRFWHRWQQVRYGAYISFESKIGPGLYLGHLCCIVVNTQTVIGRNCTMSHGVTLGQTNLRSRHPGCPVIGDNVYFGSGSVVIGGIHVGDNVSVGSNSVVVKDVPAKAVVSGIPAQELSMKGSAGYVSFADWDKSIE
jgi:serine O-acetyltransferase